MRPQVEKIMDTITNIDDQDTKWTAALRFTKVQLRMMSDAHENGGKRVKGNAGALCPHTSHALEEMWEEIVGTVDDNQSPSIEIAEEVYEALKGALGDYECKMSDIVESINIPNKRQKIEISKTTATSSKRVRRVTKLRRSIVKSFSKKKGGFLV
uniref:Uncharacterized protein n=1 Tax=Grammatophora oceanica TaxID=210454 RepID=A0A7S1UP39_9STRA